MPDLELVTDLAPAGDQPEAIAALSEGLDWPSALRGATSLAARILGRPSAERHLA